MPSWQAKIIEVAIISAMPRRGLSTRGGAAGMSAGSGAPTLRAAPRRRRALRRSASGRAPTWLITSPAARQPMRAAVSQSRPRGEPVEEAGGEEVARAGGVDDRDLRRRGVHPLAAGRGCARPSAPTVQAVSGTSASARAIAASRSSVEVERLELVLVGDEEVDVGADHAQELVAVALDAEGVGEGDRHLAAGPLRRRGPPSRRRRSSPGRRSGSPRGRSTRPRPSRPRRCRRARGTPRRRGRCSSTARRRG